MPDEGAGALVLLVVAQVPVDEHGVDGGVRGDDRLAVLGGGRLDDIDRTLLQVLDQRPDRTTFGCRSTDLVVDD